LLSREGEEAKWRVIEERRELGAVELEGERKGFRVARVRFTVGRPM
jgi:hypothetical protein